MKRLLCVLMCTVIIIAAIVPLKISLEKEIRLDEVEAFCDAVIGLSRKYDTSAKYSALKFDAKGNKIAGASNNRLILESEDAESERAIDKVTGIGYTIFQYSCYMDMLSDFQKFSSEGLKVQKDNILYCCEDTELQKADGDTNSSWGYEFSGADYIKKCSDGSFRLTFDESDTSKVNFSDDEIVVGILDSGIDSSHELFDGRIIENNINFSSGGKTDSSEDDNDHGTEVASVVVQSTPNNVKVKPYKVLDSSGVCSSLQVLAACEYILARSDKPDIINISFTGYSQEDALIENEAVGRLVDAGITVCTCAGNDFVPVEYTSIAGSDKVITVSSHSSDGSFSSFSCYGDAVDICAPGENIYCAKRGGGYTEVSGTSFAAPFVSSACAYVLMQSPGLSPNEIKDRIINGAVDMGSDERLYYGAGLLNMSNLIEYKRYPSPTVTEGGTYYDNAEISFAGIPDGVKLYYTLDRTIPDEKNGELYAAPFTTDCDTLVTYVLISDGEYLSDIKSECYTVRHIGSDDEFVIDSSGNITACNTAYKNIIVPEKINGITPVSVGKAVFKGSSVTAVELPASVIGLGESCFENCTSLKYITAEGVEKFTGAYVFSGCSELRSEKMPKLKKGSDNAFYNCSKLHYVDFGESLEGLESQMLAKSGIIMVNLSKKILNSSNGYYAFRDTPISRCDITGCDVITSYMFSGCKFLKSLECSGVKEIMPYAFQDCSMLKSIDASQVERLSANALDSSYFDVFYAPKCTTVDGGKSPFSKYSYIKVLDLPALTDKLCTKWMAFSTIEELYLDSVTELSVSCFTNTPRLSTVYLPNAENFYTPYVNTAALQVLISGNEIFKENPPMKIVWIPKAQIISGTVDLECPELFFAPASTRVYLNISSAEKSPVIVVSPDIWSINFSVLNYSDYKFTVVSAYDCALNKSNRNYSFIPCTEVTFTGEEDNSFCYIYSEGDIKIPSDFVRESWNTDDINKTREDSLYQFVLDTVNDNIINAKDYSLINKSAA